MTSLKKMIPKLPYDKTVLREILSDADYRTIDDNGTILPPSHGLFKKISELMVERGSPITPKHVHTIINNNRAGFRDMICKVFNITKKELSFCENDGNFSGENRSGQSDTLTSRTSVKMNVVISQEKWKKFAPQEKMYGRRIYWKLRPGWADVLAEALWMQHHLDCVFVFKNHNICLSAIAKFYLTIEGYCRECGAKIHATILKKPPKDGDIILECNIEGIEAASHTGTKRRQLKGSRCREVADILIDGGKDAVSWRRCEAGRIKKFGDNNPPILPTNEVVRKAKEQRLLYKYGLQFGDPALNLLKSAEHGKLVGCIQSIGLHKFNCIYWLPEQIQIYISRVHNDPQATLAIDATGGIAKRDKSQKPHIFLYQCVLVTQEGSVPTFQMVSADQRSIIVSYFLSHILAANAPIPPIVVTDFGWSLLIAIAQIFGGCANLKEYLQKCYDAIAHKATSLPLTFMRLDVCHLMSMITRWPCLKGKDKCLVRRFYKRCIGKAVQITDLEDLSYFLESVLVVSLSKCIGSEQNGRVLPSVERLHFLNSRIKGIDINSDDDNDTIGQIDEEVNDNDFEHDEGHDFIELGSHGWKSWRDQLYDAAVIIAEQSTSGDTINACYNSDFAKRLKRYLLPYVALWTGVMVPIFKRGSVTPTSAAVEAEFADLKHREFRGEIPMRIDRFVTQHLEKLEYKILERCKESDCPTKTKKNYQGFEGLPLSTPELDCSSQKSILCSTPKKNAGNILPEFTSDETLALRSVGILNTASNESSGDENIPADNYWNVCEEWRGLEKNTKPKEPQNDPIVKKRKKQTCFDDCPEWDFIKGSMMANIPVLLNGNIAGSVRLGGSYLNVTSTCAFDSIFQGILSGLLSNRTYSSMIDTSNCPIVNLAQSVRNKKKISKDHYVQRAQILLSVPIFKENVVAYTRNNKRLDVESNAAHLAQYILEKEPSYTCRVECSCGYSKQKKYSFLSVNIDMILCEGLHMIQKAIDDCVSLQRSCFNCKKPVASANEYGSHIIIDASAITDPGYPNRDKIVFGKLCSIQKIIKICGRTYMIAAVIDYNTEHKHYVAYGVTGQFWHRYDGLLKKRSVMNPNTTTKPHLIIYAICDG